MKSDRVKKGLERAPHRSLFKAMGYTDDEIEAPLIGIVNSKNQIVPGHIHLDRVADAVKTGVSMAGGTPIEFSSIAVCDGIAMGHSGMNYSLASRELIADSIETMALAHAFDGLVMITNCDKVVPGMLMAALRVNVPAVIISGGPMLSGCTDGKRISLSNIFEAVGARFSDRVVSDINRFAPKAKVIHLDIDSSEIGKNVAAYHYVLGDVKDTLQRINQGLDHCIRDEWINRVEVWKEKYPTHYRRDGRLRPQYIIEKICEVSKGEAIIATDVGQHQIWSAQYYKYTKPGTYISSGGLGTMGYGLGASIGAQIGRPDKWVFNITGDGCFRMNSIEIATAVRYNIPVIVVVLNNHALGMVRQWQRLFYDRRFSQTTLDRTTDFVKLAEAYGATGINLTQREDVEGVLYKALNTQGPVVINCEIDMDEVVLPIVPPGQALSEAIFTR